MPQTECWGTPIYMILNEVLSCYPCQFMGVEKNMIIEKNMIVHKIFDIVKI